ncbi:MAG: DUF5682 family protein, partial [Pseudomonadota bacterium]
MRGGRAEDGRGERGAGVDVLGVRHHDPASAILVQRRLVDLDPAAVLIEGPPEARSLAAAVGVRPPAALLYWRTDAPEAARAYALAPFSPEWAAIAWARRRRRPVRFIDAPQSLRDPAPSDAAAREESGFAGLPVVDPAWWDRLGRDAVEQEDPRRLFLRIQAAAAFSRTAAPQSASGFAIREAWMRQEIRRARRAFEGEIAVVCGAIHAPALARAFERGAAGEDARAVSEARRGLDGRPALAGWRAGWAPWSLEAFGVAAGGGAAGLATPGWEAAVWARGQDASAAWLTALARAARSDGDPVGPADAAAASAIAQELAALRGRAEPGFDEVRDAAFAALGNAASGALEARLRGWASGRVEAGSEGAPFELDRGEVPMGGAALGPVADDLARRLRRLRAPCPVGGRAQVRRIDLRTRRGRALQAILARIEAVGLRYATPLGSPSVGGAVRRMRLEGRAENAGALLAAAGLGPDLDAAAAAAFRAEIDAAARAGDARALGALWRDAAEAAPEAALAAARALSGLAPSEADALDRLTVLGEIARADTDAPVLAPVEVSGRGALIEALESAATAALRCAPRATLERLDALRATSIVEGLAHRLSAAPDPRLRAWAVATRAETDPTADGAALGPLLEEGDPETVGALLGPGGDRLSGAWFRMALVRALDALSPSAFRRAAPAIASVAAAVDGATREAWGAARRVDETGRAEAIDALGRDRLAALLGAAPAPLVAPSRGLSRLRTALGLSRAGPDGRALAALFGADAAEPPSAEAIGRLAAGAPRSAQALWERAATLSEGPAGPEGLRSATRNAARPPARRAARRKPAGPSESVAA